MPNATCRPIERILVIAALGLGLVLGGCEGHSPVIAKASRPTPKPSSRPATSAATRPTQPTPRPASRPASRPAPLLDKAKEKKIIAALKAGLKSKVPLRVALSKQVGKHWVLALVGVTSGTALKRKRQTDNNGQEKFDRTCRCKYSQLIKRGAVTVFGLQAVGADWKVVGRLHKPRLGARRCHIAVEATFADHNKNGRPDVELTIRAFDDGCPGSGRAWRRYRSLWEFGPRRFYKQLEFGALTGIGSSSMDGKEYRFEKGAQGQSDTLMIGPARTLYCEDALGSEMIDNDSGKNDENSLESVCERLVNQAKWYAWSAKKKRWTRTKSPD